MAIAIKLATDFMILTKKLSRFANSAKYNEKLIPCQYLNSGGKPNRTFKSFHNKDASVSDV
jgi:hypothetical protein